MFIQAQCPTCKDLKPHKTSGIEVDGKGQFQTMTCTICGTSSVSVIHASCMYVCVMNREGEILLNKNIRQNNFAYFLKLILPWKSNLTIDS